MSTNESSVINKQVKSIYRSYVDNIKINFKSHLQTISFVIFLCFVFLLTVRYYKFSTFVVNVVNVALFMTVVYNIWLQFVVSKEVALIYNNGE